MSMDKSIKSLDDMDPSGALKPTNPTPQTKELYYWEKCYVQGGFRIDADAALKWTNAILGGRIAEGSVYMPRRKDRDNNQIVKLTLSEAVKDVGGVNCRLGGDDNCLPSGMWGKFMIVAIQKVAWLREENGRFVVTEEDKIFEDKAKAEKPLRRLKVS